jgi:predicted dehydrogenase
MEIGLIGINKSNQEEHFKSIYQSLDKNLNGIFSHSEEILPICSSFRIKLYQSATDLFENTDAVYFAGSLKPNKDFAINALKNSCHLFIEDISEISVEEIKKLFKVASEANVTIQLKLTKSFSQEYLQASDYLSNPKLIDFNTNFSKRLRHEDYFSEILNNLYIANKEIQSGVKKISSLILPFDKNHLSLVHIRVDFDNGAIVNMKFNNISNEDESIMIFHNKENAADINFSKHFTTIYMIENGQVIREELNISDEAALDSEIKNFIYTCKNTKGQNISESPEELKTIQATHEIIERIKKSMRPN